MATEIEEGRLSIRFWVTTIVLTAILSVVSNLWVFMQSGQCLLSLSILSGITYFMPLVFISMYFMAIMSRNRSFGGKINVYSMTYLYTILASLAWQGSADPIFIPATYWYSKAMFADAAWLTPWWFGPSQEVAQQIIQGGLSIPWAEYMPSILWWWWIYALWALFMIGLTAVLRHQWVDVEQVPFPHTMVAFEI